MVDIYLEVGKKRVFASALDWPGWYRSGRDEESAIANLIAYRPRYAAAVSAEVPESEVRVVERLEGDATTDFGAPGAIPAVDWQSADDVQLDGLIRLLQASWGAFQRAADSAVGHELAVGPRGGGRRLEQMREHVAGADRSYLAQLGARAPAGAGWSAIQHAFIEALLARVRGEVEEHGPRGGRRWPAPYAIRRSAWHALDHAWEIEDRLRTG